MLRYRKNDSMPKTLYYRRDANDQWQEVPKADYAKKWEERALEVERAYSVLMGKYKAVTAELESLSEQFNLTEQMLHTASKDNLAKDSMIKYLEARINKGNAAVK